MQTAPTTTFDPTFRAFYAGRNDAADNFRCDDSEFQTAAERESYRRGYRQVRSENRLSADMEWG